MSKIDDRIVVCWDDYGGKTAGHHGTVKETYSLNDVQHILVELDGLINDMHPVGWFSYLLCQIKKEVQ